MRHYVSYKIIFIIPTFCKFDSNDQQLMIEKNKEIDRKLNCV